MFCSAARSDHSLPLAVMTPACLVPWALPVFLLLGTWWDLLGLVLLGQYVVWKADHEPRAQVAHSGREPAPDTPWCGQPPRPEPAREAAVTGRRGVGTEYAQFLSYATQRHPIQTPGGSVPPSPLPRELTRRSVTTQGQGQVSGSYTNISIKNISYKWHAFH